TNQDGCDSIVITNLTVMPQITGVDTQIACHSFTWIDGNTYTSSNNTATHTIVGGAVNGCDSIVSLDLTIENLPTISITANNNGFVCSGKSLVLNVTSIHGASYQWTGPNGFSSNVQNPIVNSPANGTYKVMISTLGGCTDMAQIDIVVNASPSIVNATIIDDKCSEGIGEISVIATPFKSPLTYTWNNGGTTPTLSNLEKGFYTVTITDSLGCSTTASYEVGNDMHDCGCFVYVANAFSPNGDGNNDFIPVRGKCVASLNFKIFNRWGNLVFETDQLNHGWDGYYKGKLQNTAVFMYVLEATFENGEKIKESGDISLIR
ncbi:MAG TPA: gliding motility-associated C-terminal domain-containing protein, partial [Brumimicrobium sp.]|nr:gliding motility-associated C-terminal domain-containing protein [Brumimicrobium sp.]